MPLFPKLFRLAFADHPERVPVQQLPVSGHRTSRTVPQTTLSCSFFLFIPLLFKSVEKESKRTMLRTIVYNDRFMWRGNGHVRRYGPRPRRAPASGEIGRFGHAIAARVRRMDKRKSSCEKVRRRVARFRCERCS